jgi:hypothetical protein
VDGYVQIAFWGAAVAALATLSAVFIRVRRQEAERVAEDGGAAVGAPAGVR